MIAVTWSARVRYPGCEPFLLGTVVATATHAEAELRALWREISPHPMPEVVELLPGAVVYVARRP